MAVSSSAEQGDCTNRIVHDSRNLPITVPTWTNGFVAQVDEMSESSITQILCNSGGAMNRYQMVGGVFLDTSKTHTQGL
jgi:hypothetical protein